MLRQLALRNISDVTTAEAVEATIERRPRLRSISIERDRNAADYFNGVAFAPAEPHWVGFFRLVDDPVEYNVRNIKAQSQREAHSLALIILRDRVSTSPRPEQQRAPVDDPAGVLFWPASVFARSRVLAGFHRHLESEVACFS